MNEVDQVVLVYVLIGLLIAGLLGPKDWAEFRATHPMRPVEAAWKAAAGTLLATICWPIYLAVRVALWSLQHPRFAQVQNRKIAARAAASAVVHQEEDWFVAQATTVDVASQGRTDAEARENLREAVELHLAEGKQT